MRQMVFFGLLTSTARPLLAHARHPHGAAIASGGRCLSRQLCGRAGQPRLAASAASAGSAEAAGTAQDGVMERGNFISKIMSQDLASGKHDKIVTRFPPEPNGYLHIGHAKSICVNFGLGDQFEGETYMRFDDTNPDKEEQEYVDAILRDVRWLGFDWKVAERQTYASNYFERFYECAVELIREGKAYVDSLSAEEMRTYRGTLTEPGKDSPHRTRAVEENLELFAQMVAGEVADGSMVLRLKIDMGSPNLNMRDPPIYRVKRDSTHPMTGDRWKVYPMYDYAHVLTDAFEGITHSLCTLEFQDHRPLYEWILANVAAVPCQPRQIEFSRLNLQYCVVSKRKLLQLVTEKHVAGWDDPRMPTLAGLRRRGVPPEAIRLFVERTGVSKADNNIDYSVLEDCAREVLDGAAPRAMAVLDPIKVTVTSWPEGEVDWLDGPMHPKLPELGRRSVPFSRNLLIDRADFEEIPPKKYKRLKPDGEVRLRFGYVIKCAPPPTATSLALPPSPPAHPHQKHRASMRLCGGRPIPARERTARERTARERTARERTARECTARAAPAYLLWRKRPTRSRGARAPAGRGTGAMRSSRTRVARWSSCAARTTRRRGRVPARR